MPVDHGEVAHLIFCDSHQISGSCGPACGSAGSDVDSLADGARGGLPVANRVRYDLDGGNTRVVLVAFVYAVAEVTKPRRRADVRVECC